MKSGKVAENILKRAVLKKIEKVSTSQTGVGNDAGLVLMQTFDSSAMEVSTAVEVGEGVNGVTLSINRACNNLAAAKAIPQFISISIVLPESYEEDRLKDTMEEVAKVCKCLNLKVINGHTTVSKEVNESVISVTALGAVAGNPADDKKLNIKNGQIVMTKYAGMSGSALLAINKKKELEGRYLKSLIEKGASHLSDISVIKEAEIASAFGSCEMHDVSEGGVFGAIWELVSRIGAGCEIDLKKIPIRQETVEITEFFDINPYQLKGDGSLLIVTENGSLLVDKLKEAGIQAAVIGYTSEGNDRILRNEDEIRFMEPNRVEEYERVR